MIMNSFLQKKIILFELGGSGQDITTVTSDICAFFFSQSQLFCG